MSVDTPNHPSWVPDAVFYQIFPDRFARSLRGDQGLRLDSWGAPPTIHGYQGGDLWGVLERLDHLSDLGINAIYFNPVFQSASNHRYHTHDYERVDPMLGGNEALRRLLDECHNRGIRVILDGVFNHASRGFFQFHDILESGESSAYLDWFTVTKFPLHAYDATRPPSYAAWFGLKALPKFNTNNPAVREFLWGIGRKWIDFGIDGWRLDVPKDIEHPDFWREFRRRVLEANPEAYLVGEIWHDAPDWTVAERFHGLMNYQLTKACIAFFIAENLDGKLLMKTSLYPPGPPGAEAFRAAIERLWSVYGGTTQYYQMNSLDSHDMARFLTLAKGDGAASRLAWLFLLTYPGAPCIYYGDEIGLPGGHDPDNRRAFPWDETEWDTVLLRDLKHMIALRHESAALRRGDLSVLLAKGQTYVHQRRLGNETVVVALNASEEAVRFDIPCDLPEGSVFRERWASDAVRVDAGALRGVRLQARSGRVFQHFGAHEAR